MGLVRIMDDIWKESDRVSPAVQQLNRGRYFFISLQKDINRIKRLRSLEKVPSDKNDLVSGENLFPLTLRLWNWKETLPGTTVNPQTSRSLELYRLHYFGVSPELENFAALVLWPENSQHSFETLKHIYHAIESQKQPLLHFEGDYRIKLPNEIHPYRFSKIETEFEDRTFEWRYIPWLKEIGDTIFEHRSPASYRKVYLDAKGIDYAYINPRICIGIVKDILKSTGEIKLKLPYLTSNAKRKYLLARVLLNGEIDEINSGDIIFFILLEVVHNYSSFIPERYIYYIKKADFIDILGHLSVFVIYNMYLDKYGLYIMSVPEFQRLYTKILFSASKYCKECNKTEGLTDWELLFSSYLEPFFTIINQRIYYVPRVLTQSEYIQNHLGIDADKRTLIQRVDVLLLETRESRKNFPKINIIKAMEETGIHTASELRSLLKLTGKVAFIKQLNKMLKGSVWRWNK